MNTPHSPEEIEQIAQKRASAKMGWYIHATVYLLVNLWFFAMSDNGWGSRAWSVKPLLGWGLGLVLHGLSVWFLGAGSGLREMLVERERKHLQKLNNKP